ncbi:MAG: DUF47 domain-containing protein [Deltaproteobacteria bacterium]|nr:DUF47 domain-containing protein [Deltaproteobacteria bacterium]
MLERVLSRKNQFFDLFDAATAVTVEAAEALRRLLDDIKNVDAHVAAIKDIEHRGDDITHQTMSALHQSFVTPIDREDIHALITTIDDVTDLIDGAAQRFVLYRLTTVPKEFGALADVLVRMTRQVKSAVSALRELKMPATILKQCVELNRLENEADELYRAAMKALFEGSPDPLTVIKWKEVYEILERATDRCEDIANIVEGVVLEQG